MSKGVPQVTSFEIGVASGLLGAGAGYILAPPKYNLEQLLIQDSVEFTDAVPIKYVSKTSDRLKAYNSIVNARENLIHAFDSNIGEAKLVEYIRTPKLIEAYKSIKKVIPRARVQTAVIAGILSGVGAVFVRIFSGIYEKVFLFWCFY